MKRRWVLLALLAGLFTSITVLIWPARPLWQLTLDDGLQLVRFTRDGQTLLTATGTAMKFPWPSSADRPMLYRFDAMTGQPRAPAVELPTDSEGTFLGHNLFALRLCATPTGDRIIIDKWMSSGGTLSMKLHDLATGRTVSLPDKLWIDDHDFSPDGRWLCVFHTTPTVNNISGIDILEGTTGERVLTVLPERPTDGWSCAFAPDSSAVAILDNGEQLKGSILTIRELPSGAIRQQFMLPRGPLWNQIIEWHPNKLYIGAEGLSGYTVFWFDPEASDPSASHPEPLLDCGETPTGYRYSVPLENGVVRIEREPPPSWTEAHLAKLKLKTGWSRLKVRKGNRLTFFDVDGSARRYQLPQMPYPLLIEPHGRLVACVVDGKLEVWDADPSPRWPWALLAGVGTMLPVLLFGHRRAKR